VDYCIDKAKVREMMKIINIKTQTQLAEKLGITKNQLSVILSEKNNPFKSNIQLLSEKLNVSPLDLIFTSTQDNKGINSKEYADEAKQQYVDVSTVKAVTKFNVVELFAGAGGLAAGLEKAGFNTVGLVEIDRYAAETLRRNRPEWNIIEEDVINVANNGIKNYIGKDVVVDLLSGGYPCQSFSYAGHKKGLEDVRGTLFFYYASILEQLKPKVFLAENVRGLISHDDGKTLATMQSVFRDIGYKVDNYLLNANNYNVAQKRERTVIIGVRDDIELKYLPPQPYEYKPILRDALKDVPLSDGCSYPEKKRKILELVPPGGCWRDLPDDTAKDYMGKSYYSGGGRTGMARKISWDEPCLTLTCSPAQKQTERCHPDEIRPFTVREYARIQSFDDDWKFFGSINQQYKQIGNAVPVELAKAIGLSIIALLNKINDQS
jgi:DNA (cytosine-5)-methyltransferase 1